MVVVFTAAAKMIRWLRTILIEKLEDETSYHYDIVSVLDSSDPMASSQVNVALRMSMN
jgi:hypothetical protein